MSETEEQLRTRLERIVEPLRRKPGPLLEVLHAVQHEFGYVPAGAIAPLAEMLNLSRAEVHGVLSFYHHFRHSPPGNHVLQLCRAEACQSVGARALAAHVMESTGLDWHQTSGDGLLSLEPVFCLGNCACGPAAMLDGELHGRVSAVSIDALLASLVRPT
jgi:formate dehydrogenase subunit gamma